MVKLYFASLTISSRYPYSHTFFLLSLYLDSGSMKLILFCSILFNSDSTDSTLFNNLAALLKSVIVSIMIFLAVCLSLIPCSSSLLKNEFSFFFKI